MEPENVSVTWFDDIWDWLGGQLPGHTSIIPAALDRHILRISHLSLEITKNEVAGLFQGYQINSIIFRRDFATGCAQASAFVAFNTEAEAETAVKKLAHKPTIGGQRVIVSRGVSRQGIL